MSDAQVKTERDAAGAKAAAQAVVETHRRLSAFLRPGQTLAQIDAFVESTLTDLGCVSAFYGYVVPGHPPFMSHACLSVNECVVHGTRGYYTQPMKTGDVLKIDIGVKRVPAGEDLPWVGDAAWTYVFGEPTELVRRLMESGKESLRRGVATMRPGGRLIDWAVAVQDCVEKEYGFRCVQHWGGHGYNFVEKDRRTGKRTRTLHGPPHLLNHRPTPGEAWREMNDRWTPGMTVAVEPMIAVATGATFQLQVNGGRAGRGPRDWPVYIEDRGGGRTLTAEERLSVHYEHDVLIGPSGPIVLTEGLESINDVIA